MVIEKVVVVTATVVVVTEKAVVVTENAAVASYKADWVDLTPGLKKRVRLGEINDR